jgi:hypothetical protein
MSVAHSKLRSELSHAQVFAHFMIGFDGPSVPDYSLISEHNWTLRSGNQIGLCTFTRIISIECVLFLFNFAMAHICFLLY